MIRVLLDTNAYAAFKRGHAETVAILQRTDVVAVSPVVLGELLGGFAAGNKSQQNRAELATFLSSPRVWTVSVDAITVADLATP